MKPSDVLPQDRHRYYDHGWMWDTESKAPVYVRYTDSRFTAYRGPTDGKGFRAKLQQLEPYYPDGRCINTYNVGVCVQRRARQTARRTASIQHYEVAFAPPGRRLTMDNTILWELACPSRYPSLKKALKKIQDEPTLSCAISPNLIIWKPKEEPFPCVMWNSEQAGFLEDGIFVPVYDGSCFTKLTRLELQGVAPQCL